ncbi:TetR/AcrR family transcriptional regulator [Tsukamurella ocularis]|uniref:TetR/AcrR family transcriptional regulator n=1 Tax=Tsukamurella ocularis TaxID=1970234 RepID=UPI0039EE82CF
MPAATPGRPRSAAAERAIVEAVLAELEDVGYQGLTIETVAKRAGVGRPTIYRRWPDRDALVVGALIATVPPLRAPSTDDPVADLRALVAAFLGAIAHSPAARAVLAVHAAGAHRPDLRAALHEHYLAPRAEVLADTVGRARAAGAIRDDVTDAQVRDLLFGPAVYRWLIVGEVPPPSELDDVFDLALAALGP